MDLDLPKHIDAELEVLGSTDDTSDKRDLIVGNMVSFKYMLESGISMDKYFSAVKFVTNKSIGMSNIDAYEDACKDKYDELYYKWVTTKGLSEEEFRGKKLAPIVNYFSNSSLVKDMIKCIKIPTKIFNMGYLQESLDVARDLMYNSKSDLVKIQAAKTLIDYLGDETGEEEKMVEERKDERIDKYEQLLSSLAEAKLDSMRRGGDVHSITNVGIIDVEAT